jgi:hypothetical protein
MEAFVVLKVIVFMMCVGLHSPETMCAFIFESGLSFQQTHEQGPINTKVLLTSVSRV